MGNVTADSMEYPRFPLVLSEGGRGSLCYQIRCLDAVDRLDLRPGWVVSDDPGPVYYEHFKSRLGLMRQAMYFLFRCPSTKFC